MITPHDQLTAAAGEIGDSLKAADSVRALIKQAIATNPMLVAMMKELEGIDELREDFKGFQFCYNELMKAAPWSESNDMDIADEFGCGLNGLIQERDALQIKCAELQNRVKELEKDKERLDWLEKLAGAPIVTLSTMDADGSEVDEEIGRGDTLRAAIDSITQGKEPSK